MHNQSTKWIVNNVFYLEQLDLIWSARRTQFYIPKNYFLNWWKTDPRNYKSRHWKTHYIYTQTVLAAAFFCRLFWICTCLNLFRKDPLDFVCQTVTIATAYCCEECQSHWESWQFSGSCSEFSHNFRILRASHSHNMVHKKRKYHSVSILNNRLSPLTPLSPGNPSSPRLASCSCITWTWSWDSFPFWFIAEGSRNRPALSRDGGGELKFGKFCWNEIFFFPLIKALTLWAPTSNYVFNVLDRELLTLVLADFEL